MDRSHLAEILLRPLCGRKRSTEIIGDLLELESARQGSLWAGVLSAIYFLSWRSVAAIVIAITSTLYGLVHYLNAFQQGPDRLIHMVWGIGCCLAAASVWSVVVLNALRCGLRNRTTAVGVGLTALLLTMACLKGLSYTPMATIVLVSCYVAACAMIRPLRGVILAVVASATTQAGLFWLIVIYVHEQSMALGFAATGFFGGWILSLIVEAAVLTRTQRYLRITGQDPK